MEYEEARCAHKKAVEASTKNPYDATVENPNDTLVALERTERAYIEVICDTLQSEYGMSRHAISILLGTWIELEGIHENSINQVITNNRDTGESIAAA